VTPQSPAKSLGPFGSKSQPLTPTGLDVKKWALDVTVCDAEDRPGKKVMTFIDVKPSEADMSKSTVRTK